MAYNDKSLNKLGNMHDSENLISFTEGIIIYYAEVMVDSEEHCESMFDEITDLLEEPYIEVQIISTRYRDIIGQSCRIYQVLHEGVPYITFNVIPWGEKYKVIYNQQLMAISDYSSDRKAAKALHDKVMEMNHMFRTYASLHEEQTTGRLYPCDLGECPFGESYGMYFCRDNCGLGVDEDTDEDTIPKP